MLALPGSLEERAEEKKASRLADADALASGMKTRAQLGEENSFIRARNVVVDLRAKLRR